MDPLLDAAYSSTAAGPPKARKDEDAFYDRHGGRASGAPSRPPRRSPSVALVVVAGLIGQ